MTTLVIAEPKPVSVLSSYLRPSLFISDLKSRTKAAVLLEMVEALVRADVTRRPDAVLEALRRREELGSTGLGKGIAVPHARSTVVAERAVLVARSSKGVEFAAADGKPVHLCFLVVGPPLENDPIYLRLVADLVRTVRLARTRQRILQAPDFLSVRRILLKAIDDE